MARKLRVAVVGLGHIAQVAVLPAFKHSKRCVVGALVSDDPEKRRVLGDKYGVTECVSYERYDALLASGTIDAVYICLPNHLHCDYTIRAARAGVHVLCEKPMAVTEHECHRMISACEEARVKLMIGYRLHFEAANMHAVELARKGTLGELRLFTSAFTMDVEAGNVRLRAEAGGGTLFDIGIYCINAARYLFAAEPTHVNATSVRRADDARFARVDEMSSLVLRFPGDRLASFVTSFGAASVSSYRLFGTKGSLELEPAYSHFTSSKLTLQVGDKTTRRSFRRRDQFAPELDHFAECVLLDREPGPNGLEGMIDVRIIEAALASARRNRPIEIAPLPAPVRRPGPSMVEERPAHPREPEEVNASGPRRED